MRNFIFGFLLLFLLASCATEKPAVRMETGVSLSGYKGLEVTPFSNDTGKTFDFNVTASLTDEVKSKLKDKGFTVIEGTDAEENVLVIKSSLISYEPGSVLGRWVGFGLGSTQCIVKSTLIDKKTGKTVGEMVTSEMVSGGGLFSAGAHKYILNMVASAIADEIDRRVKGEK